MIIKTQTAGLLKKLERARNKIPTTIKAEVTRASEKVRTQAIGRFSSFFNASKHADVLAAIQQAGINVLQSNDDETTVLMYDYDTMDSLTKQISPATGRIHHLWRILHEGSGPEGLRGHTNTRTAISKRSGFLQAPYHVQAIVQTVALRPFYEPGRYPPFFDLVQQERLGFVKILRSPGFEGHAWFLRNNQLFEEDINAFRTSVGVAVRKIVR